MTITDTQSVFAFSRVNGANYDGDNLPVYPWKWPTDGFLARRKAEIAIKEMEEQHELNTSHLLG